MNRMPEADVGDIGDVGDVGGESPLIGTIMPASQTLLSHGFQTWRKRADSAEERTSKLADLCLIQMPRYANNKLKQILKKSSAHLLLGLSKFAG